ncbi:UDP-glycosyltransferase UGT5-like isoform X2 [Neodiprion virginianus]|uniref:UDP-glycosyltransferase UGT5-like isoform X2 n=1 Tax=Neodiprion virginianus TaxID=2961670 RepID=UPI001EE70B12|nr:UDP-glycosyltransferase UGT5-like isoform X2 [Neodiprion virginianus]
MLRSFVSATLILLAAFWHYGYASRILGVFPTPSISHQIVFRALTLALRERGHQLVVVTPDPVNDPMLTNYTEIDLHFLYADTDGGENWIETLAKERWTDIQDAYLSTVLSQTELILDHPELKKLYAPNNSQKFNLMMIEMLYYPALLPLATRFDVPVVGITSLGLSLSIHYAIGNPIIPSHSSNWDTEEMIFGEATFWQRLKNFIWVWKFLYKYRTRYMPAQQALARKYFGNDIPDISDIEKNVSVVFVNQQTPISYLRPNIPKVIDIGGFHIAREIKPLPKDLQKILDDSTQGFIYMSLGSNIKSVMLSDEVRREFIAAFSELPYTVIWKFEDDFLANKPENVIIMKWTPQQSILAHPNLKVFIYQGGLQSTEEAVSHGIPVIGLPVFTDQHVHANKMLQEADDRLAEFAQGQTLRFAEERDLVDRACDTSQRSFTFAVHYGRRAVVSASRYGHCFCYFHRICHNFKFGNDCVLQDGQSYSCNDSPNQSEGQNKLTRPRD